MKKIFYPLFVALTAVSPVVLQAAQSVPTKASVVRVQDMQSTVDGKTKALARGDLLGDGATVSGKGFMQGQVYPGLKMRVAGDANAASFAFNKNVMTVENGYVTGQSAETSLKSGRVVTSVSRAPDGVVNSAVVDTDFGTATPESVDTLQTKFLTIKSDKNIVIACHQGTVYFSYHHGVPNYWHSNGTKDGDRKVVIVIPAGMVFDMDEFNKGGTLTPLEDAARIDPSLLPENQGENDPNNPVDEPPVVVSPSGL